MRTPKKNDSAYPLPETGGATVLTPGPAVLALRQVRKLEIVLTWTRIYIPAYYKSH